MQTVSNLAQRPHEPHGGGTEQRIRAVIDQLGYTATSSRAACVRRARGRLAFLVTDASARFLADPMTDLFLAGLGDDLRDRDHGLLIQSAHPDARPSSRCSRPLRRAALTAPCSSSPGPHELRSRRVERLQQLGMPTILLQEHGVPPDQHPSVTPRTARAAASSAATCSTRGHERIGYLTAADSWSAIEERSPASRRRTRRPDAADVGCDHAPRDVLAARRGHARRDLLRGREPPTAILCGNDLIALGVLKAARELGMRVPQDLAVAGFDDFDFAEALDPPLTTVRIPGYEMGRQAARSLVHAVETGTAPESHTFPVEVCLRGSA